MTTEDEDNDDKDGCGDPCASFAAWMDEQYRAANLGDVDGDAPPAVSREGKGS